MLPPLCAAFLTGLVIGEILPYFPASLFCLLLVFTLILFAGERVGRVAQSSGLLCCAALCSGIIYWTWMTPPISTHPGDEPAAEASREYRGRIAGLVQHAPSRLTMLVDLRLSADDRTTPRRIRLTWRDPGEALFAGDHISFHVKLHRPTGSLNPRGFDYSAYVERQGIGAVGTANGSEAVSLVEAAGSAGWWWQGWGRIDRWRGDIRDAAIRSLSQPALGLFLGIVIGERGYVRDDIQEWFMTTGTVHLLSISGSHLGLVAVVTFWVLRRGCAALPAVMLMNLSRWITPTRVAILGTWCVVTLYALLAGAELATMRAWIMTCFALGTIWIGSNRYLWHALAGAAVVILLHDPHALNEISFQLSFLSALAIVAVVTPSSHQPDPARQVGTKTKWRNWSGHVREAVVLGAVVTLLTTPLVAWYFNQVPWLGLVTNLVAVPYTGVILVPIGLLAAVVTLIPGVEAFPFALVQQTLLEWMVNVLHWCAVLPGSDWRVSAPALWVMVMFYLGVWCVVGARPYRYRRILGGGLMAMALGGWIWSGAAAVDDDRWRVTFLDVGQGDSAVVQLPGGKTVLIDGGRKYEGFDMGRSIIAPYLLNQGIRRLDHIIATHPQQDHVGGLPWVIRHLDVGEFWHAGIERSEPLFEELRRAVVERQVSDHRATRGDELIQEGFCRLTVLNPVRSNERDVSIQSASGTYLNNESIVVQLGCGQHRIVFAADIETDGLHRLATFGQDPVTVLKVPHHGARSSLNRDWIARAHPRYAVFSAGRRNSYGHPVPDVIAAYAAVGSEILRTDIDGAVIVTGRISTSDLQVRRMRDVVLQPVASLAGLWGSERDNWQRLFVQSHEL